MSIYESDIQSPGYCEYLTPVKPSGKIKTLRVLIVALAAVLSILMLTVTLATVPVVSFMLLVGIVFFAWFAFQFTKLEYEYVIVTGTLEISKILGARTRKTLFEMKLSDVSAITPLGDIKSLGGDEKNIIYACDKDDENAICLAYKAESGEKCILVISAPAKTVNCLKHYRRNAFTPAMISFKY